MKKFWWRAAAAAGMLAVAATLFAALNDTQAPQALKTVHVDSGPVTSYVRATGTVSSVHDVRLAVPQGGQVRAVQVAVGSVVRAGDELLRLDDKDAELQLAADELAIREIAEGLGHQERALEGLRADHAAGAVSREQVTKAEEQAALLRIQRQKAVARAAQTRERIRQSTLRAPIAGTVTDIGIRPGEVALAGQPVITLSDSAHQQILARMEQDDAQDLRVGMAVRVSLDGAQAQSTEEHVVRIEPAVRKDGNASYTAVWISLASSSLRLPPNQQVDVRVPVGSRAAVPRLPLEALADHNGKAAVWTLDQGTLRLRPITTGVMGDRFVEVLSGVSAGQAVVLAEGRTLKEGAPARAAAASASP